jgi:hypothetical protein
MIRTARASAAGGWARTVELIASAAAQSIAMAVPPTAR